MAETSKQDQDLTSQGQDLPPLTKEKPLEDVVTKKENESKKDRSTVMPRSNAVLHMSQNQINQLGSCEVWGLTRLSSTDFI